VIAQAFTSRPRFIDRVAQKNRVGVRAAQITGGCVIIVAIVGVAGKIDGIWSRSESQIVHRLAPVGVAARGVIAPIAWRLPRNCSEAIRVRHASSRSIVSPVSARCFSMCGGTMRRRR